MTIQSVLDEAVTSGAMPFAVAMAGNSGGITFEGAAGEAAPGCAAGPDTVFRIFSMTKAIGALAAMMLIDRGQLRMDTRVAEILPDWDRVQVLDRFDGDTPVMRPPKETATIRHLATHTAGMDYEFWDGDVRRYMQAVGLRTIMSGRKASLLYPLMADPGTRWSYGPGSDWLGQVVEAVDGRRIDTFCREEIFAPLGMDTTRFEPDGLEDRLAAVWQRQDDGGFARRKLSPPAQPEFYGMGHALYSTAGDYMRFLRMVLNRGALDGERLLSEQAVGALLADQMRGLTVLPMRSATPATSADFVLPADTTHSFAFARFESDQPGKRRAGSQGWAGIANTHFWLDPAADVAAVLMTQSLPFAEPRFMSAYDAYERAVYDQ
ncbi:serine hydrolase domain-containing protein [Lutimaribacter marinistellae]|uniref:Serine hydrolase domain-containing protein n=1 Tax=Lutimaribacter marinistellae TaxID=1820329 RepID=A0ABV7TDU6_9RHOB